MNAHPTETERAWDTGACPHTVKYENHLRERVRELAKRKAEFSRKQADRLMILAGGTDDPQLRAQLVIMSNAWIDQSASTRLRFKLVDAWRRQPTISRMNWGTQSMRG
jgi:hypothetical protein